MSEHCEKDANALINIVLEHYLKHHELVLKKLHVAQEATMQAMDEGGQADDSSAVQTIWAEIIDVFADCGISEEGLDEIEALLGKTPQAIRQTYEEMLTKDDRIQALLDQLDTKAYKDALKKINAVQEAPNPMSGLSPSDYDEPVNKVSKEETGKLQALPEEVERRWWE